MDSPVLSMTVFYIVLTFDRHFAESGNLELLP